MSSFWCLSDSFIQYYKTRTVWRFSLFTDAGSKDERPGNLCRPPSILLSLFFNGWPYSNKNLNIVRNNDTSLSVSLSRSVSLWKDHGSLIAHNLSFYLVVDNDWRTQEVCNWWWFWFRLLILLYFYSKGNLDAVKMSQDGFSVLFLPPFDDVAEIIAHDYVFVKKCICTCWNTEFGFLTFFIH